MDQQKMNVKAVFDHAFEIASLTERTAYLNQACAGDPELQAKVEGLLRASEDAGSFLQSPAPGLLPPTVNEPQITERPGTVIGPYKLLQQIGEGGMGVVFMAEQTHPVQRKVALKVIKPGMDSRQVIARFEAERQALAMMDHVNIARVLDAGTTGSEPHKPDAQARESAEGHSLAGASGLCTGRPYFVMELVHGVPITKYCDDNHLTPRERLELFVPVCQAIQHAHQKGIIHRDIKPSNVMVTLYDGKPVPKVIDFGVAKATEQRLTERTLFTQYGTMVGTLEYMSPEQAEMSALGVDTRSDIYSLGVLLYELLTGSTPLSNKRVREAAYGEVLRMIKEEEPPKPSTRLSDSGEALASISAQRHTDPAKLAKLLRGELDWIVMKTLEKDRNRRYETAKDFAADVQRYLNDDPVQACPPSVAYRFRKFARRNKVALATASVVSLAVVLAVVILAVSNVRISREKHQKEIALTERGEALSKAKANSEEAQKQETLAKQNAKQADEQRGIAERNEKTAIAQERLANRRYYSAQMNLAMQAWQAGEVPRVLELLDGQRPRPDEEDLRGFEWYYLWGLGQQGRWLTLRGHKGGVRSVAFLPDGKTLVSCGGGEVRLWDWASGKQQEPVLSGVGCMAVSADGKILATGSGHTTLYDVATMKTLADLQTGWVQSLAVSPDGSTLATGTESGVVMLWDIGTGKRTFTLSGHSARVLAVTFSPDGKTLATGTGWGDGVTKLWDLTADPPRVTHQFRSAKNGLAFFPDGRTLLIAGWGSASFYDVTSGQSIQEEEIGSGFNWVSAALSPDGKTLAFGLEERTVKLWDRAKGHQRSYGHLKEVWCVAFSPDGKVVAAGTEDGIVQLWSVFPEPELTLRSVVGFTCAALSRGRETLALGTNDGKVKLWDMLTGQERATLSGHSAPVTSVAFSTDGKALASASGAGSETAGTGEVKVWEAATGREVATLDGHKGFISSVAFSPNGQTVASGSFDGTAKLWDVATRQARFTLTGQRVKAVRFSPDGSTLATGGQGGVTLWDTASGEKKAAWVHPGGDAGSYVMALDFSPNGKLLATGGSAGTGTIKLWDAGTGEPRASLKGHTTAVYSVAFGPDGQTLASASSDGSVRLWDVATGQERINLKFPRGPIWPFVTFAQDGNTLVMGRPDGTVQLLRAATDPEALARRANLDSDDANYQIMLAAGNYRLSLASAAADRPGEAEELLRRTFAPYERLANAFPGVAAYRTSPVAICRDVGKALKTRGHLAAAENAFRQGLQFSRKLLDESPDTEAYQLLVTQCWFDLAVILAAGGKLPEAANAYQEIVKLTPTSAVAHNNLAWLLATCPDAKFRDARRAVELAKKAVELAPKEGNHWNTLGVAHYRSGDWKAAIAALEKSMEFLAGKEESFNTFFLAMAHWQLGEKEDARKWYEQAVAWTETNKPQDEELKRFRAEASELLGIKEKKD